MWKVGDRLAHRYNSDLGPGRVQEVSGRRVRVEFPYSAEGEVLSFAVNSDALVPLVLAAGSRARIEATGEVVTVESGTGDGRFQLTDGRELALRDVWPLPEEISPIDRLARGEIGAWEDFANRLDGLRLQRLRQADGLGSFLGGRIQLFPHQLYVAERACRRDPEQAEEEASPVRWLLADEVGLGKTVEACLIMNRMIHTSRADRTLVVAPESLTVQWLGELWRKHHQVFVLLDEKRLSDVERDYGQGFNPFEVYRQAIISLEQLRSRRHLAEQATAVGIDLLVVDEAHHLKRPVGHPGNAGYRAVEPIAARGRNVLLLTATPLEEDAHGFFRLLQMLRPDDLPEASFDEWLRHLTPLPPCTSACRRVDVGGLPPRRPIPIEIDDPAATLGWQHLARIERLERSRPVVRGGKKRKADRVFRALASPAALIGRLDPSDEEGGATAPAARDADPRITWLVDAVAVWQRGQEKTLVFVAHKESLDLLKAAVEQRSTARVGIFHEGLSLKRRDVEVAQFRLPDGPVLLISTECGGEGRNFEFCRRLVLFDLPWSPAVVEQRIGRLDRIGRTLPTEIVYFRPPGGLGRAIVRLYEEIGLFSEPLGALERELRHVQQEIEQVAVGGPENLEPGTFDDVLGEARDAGARVRQAAYHTLHAEPYQQDMAAPILSRVPRDLEILNEEVVLRAAARFGFEIEQQSGVRTWLIEHGSQALVDHLPGMAPGSRFLGTFDRATAVADETIDFFASGHPLVEGILAELEEGARGRVALLQVAGPEEVFGLLAIYRRGADFEPIAIDSRGERRDDLATRLSAAGIEREHIEARKWTSQPSWKRGIRRLAASLPSGEVPSAVAAFRVRQQV